MASSFQRRNAVLSEEAALQLSSKAFPKSAGQGVLWTSDPRIELPTKIPATASVVNPVTMMEAFAQTVRTCHSDIALRVKRGGVWIEWTYGQYYDSVKLFGRACLHPRVALRRFQGVSILAANNPEWVIAGFGGIFAGGIEAGIYTTNTADAVAYVLENCEAGVCVVDDPAQLEKVMSVRHRLPNLRAVVLSLGTVPPAHADAPGVYDWKSFLALGLEVPETELIKRMDEQRPGNCCCLIYTSGTTAHPKGVMLSHDNVVFTATSCNNYIGAQPGETLVSYLPLSHIAAAECDQFGAVIVGAAVSFAMPDALKGTLVQTLVEVRPTLFLAVPRVWEKIEERLRAVGASNGALKQRVADWAKRVGAEGTTALMAGNSVPWGWTLANGVIFSAIRKALGFDRCRGFFSGAAPLSVATAQYFASLGMQICETFGMSECTGPHSSNRALPGLTKFGTCGIPITETETRIDRPDAKGEGEVCMRGRHVFMGYLHNPAATQSTIDSAGWLHSGDLGIIDKDGFLSITGRIKDIIITAGGENVAPTVVERLILDACPALSNAMIVGDRRRFLSALFTLKVEPDADMNPTDKLADPALKFALAAGSSATTATAASSCPAVRTALEAVVKAANKKTISRAAQVQKWAMVTPDFSIAGGELTPTTKLKRRVVEQKHAAIIEAMYADAPGSTPSKAKL